MIYEQDITTSSNISTIKYHSMLKELAVYYIPKPRKNSFKTLEALQQAQQELMEELGQTPTENVWQAFKDRYNLDFFDELNRLERKATKIYIYSNVTLDIYNQIVGAESVGGKLNELVISKPDDFPFRTDIVATKPEDEE